MTTNKVSFISMMFVVGIIYQSAKIIFKFNFLDLLYLLFIILCFMRFIYIRKVKQIKE